MDLLAYKDQAKDRLTKILPSNWQWSLSTRRPSTIILTIKAASEDFLDARIKGREFSGYLTPIDAGRLESIYEGNTLMAMKQIKSALAGESNGDGGKYAVEILLGSVRTPFKRLR